ncbi:hypothetical protein WOLCODRAFT_155388 [Wolfiporia cocos MD-104 SS10]|uniref:Transcription and mRNA export factor SUS1 n=1 Tax=Wolfiporia cocos (strain MD-104) TaxID=742152 RepID=A0A2H3IXN4_WOLCO|nr:hypothetical protein WOLCODRAFT_155388 [Wolfiporia cocos MD-104 SS10]
MSRDELYAQLRRRMVERGEWDRLYSLLAQKLNESGWTDETRDRAQERIRGGEDIPVESVLEELRAGAGESVRAGVRAEVQKAIRVWMEAQVEG